MGKWKHDEFDRKSWVLITKTKTKESKRISLCPDDWLSDEFWQERTTDFQINIRDYLGLLRFLGTIVGQKINSKFVIIFLINQFITIILLIADFKLLMINLLFWLIETSFKMFWRFSIVCSSTYFINLPSICSFWESLYSTIASFSSSSILFE